jgi:hypothetical protein
MTASFCMCVPVGDVVVTNTDLHQVAKAWSPEQRKAFREKFTFSTWEHVMIAPGVMAFTGDMIEVLRSYD